jgi:hypothetical protein
MNKEDNIEWGKKNVSLEEIIAIENFIERVSDYMISAADESYGFTYKETPEEAMEGLLGLVGNKESKAEVNSRYKSARSLLSSGKKKYNSKDFSGAISDLSSAKKEFLSILKTVEKSYSKKRGGNVDLCIATVQAARKLKAGQSPTSVKDWISNKFSRIGLVGDVPLKI